MNVKFMNPILESTLNVLSTMAMVEVSPGQPSVKTSELPLGDVTGLIDFKGDGMKGSLAISFSDKAIFDIGEKMLGDKMDTIDESVVDLVGEITNMITGSAKRIYSEQGIEFDLTIPKTLVGQDQTIKHSTEGQAIYLPFNTAAGEFFVEFCFE